MHIKLCSIREQSVAGMVHGFLQNQGIHPMPLNTASHVSVAGAEQWYNISVPEEELEEARKLMIECGHEKDLIKQK